jgi:lysozyme family protein
MNPNFILAFNNTMLSEIGPWFNPNDPGTISGECDTHETALMCGYENVEGDSGGVTKYGIAKNENPNVDVQNLNLDQAMQIYYTNYWVSGKNDQITIPITMAYFDICVNNGLSRGAKLLQQSVGATPDGDIGPVTLGLVNQQDPTTLINTLATERNQFYNTIVNNNPAQQKFLSGWLERVTRVTNAALAQINTN